MTKLNKEILHNCPWKKYEPKEFDPEKLKAALILMLGIRDITNQILKDEKA